MTTRVVITGMGIVSAAGCDLATFRRTLVSGRSPVRRIRRFDVSGYPSQIAAEIDDAEFSERFELPPLWADRGRIARYAAVAAAQAIEDAGLLDSPRPWDPTIGVVMAAGMGSYDHEEVFAACAAGASGAGGIDWPAFAHTYRATVRPHAPERRTPGSIPAQIAREHGLAGPVMSVMTACAGGTQAIGDGSRWIRSGRAAAVVAGGADSELYPMGLASFCLLGALSSKSNAAPAGASRPFDAARDGFVMGEGAGMLVLEDRDRALRRGARIYAEIAGFGSACDAYRVTDPHPDGLGAILAMRRALRDARLRPVDVSYINAHGTSTIANDRTETVAIKQVFGDQAARVPVSSTKSMIGHATVAAGAIEAIATALMLACQEIHPTINFQTRDPLCDLDYVPNEARQARLTAALSNSFAFGGQSACLVLRRHQA
jgi:3-oxoacyl-[acyl-carrier-protein] synthase II